jgi:hypothetical protein
LSPPLSVRRLFFARWNDFYKLPAPRRERIVRSWPDVQSIDGGITFRK